MNRVGIIGSGLLALCAAGIPPMDGLSVILIILGLIALLGGTIFWSWINGDY